jgi:hypothetical protein
MLHAGSIETVRALKDRLRLLHMARAVERSVVGLAQDASKLVHSVHFVSFFF